MNARDPQISNRQCGVALITVLFLLALAAVIVSSLVVVQDGSAQRSIALLESEQAWQLCLSGEELARQALVQDFTTSPNIDHQHEAWSETPIVMEVDNGYIEVAIEDAEGKFNINNLIGANGAVEPGWRQAFLALVDQALHDQAHSLLLANEMGDWLDNDNNGVEENDYLSETIPYRPPNGPVSDPSEMRWLKDMDAATYATLHRQIFPSLVALPRNTAAATHVNINTVEAPVLAAMAGISIGEAEQAVASIRANKDGFNNIGQALALVPSQQANFLAANAVTYTEFFQVRVRAKFGDHYAYLTSLVFRDHQKGTLTVLGRDRGERFIFPFSKDYNGGLPPTDYDIKL